MRKVLLSLAIAASALTVAAPASAQYAPRGNAYGYNNYGQVRGLQARLDQVQRQISRLDQRNILSEREANRLRNDSQNIERQLRYSARNGLNPREADSINNRIARLEQRVQYEARDGNRYAGRNNWRDRDRDGRNDRFEDDRGTRPN